MTDSISNSSPRTEGLLSHSRSKSGSQSSIKCSSPIFKRTKLDVQPEVLASVTSYCPSPVNLVEIYRNSQRCEEIDRRLKLQQWRMGSFRATVKVADIIFTSWEASDNPDYRARRQQFSNYVVGFVMRVGPSVVTLLHALLYTLKLRAIYPRARGEQGCSHRLFVIALFVSTRYFQDKHVLIKPTHTTWSSLSGVFGAPELHRMELEFVTFLRGKLFIGLDEIERCVEEMIHGAGEDGGEVFNAVPGSVDWFELISVKSKEHEGISIVSINKDAIVP